jgi:hypothetical protein
MAFRAVWGDLPGFAVVGPCGMGGSRTDDARSGRGDGIGLGRSRRIAVGVADHCPPGIVSKKTGWDDGDL